MVKTRRPRKRGTKSKGRGYTVLLSLVLAVLAVITIGFGMYVKPLDVSGVSGSSSGTLSASDALMILQGLLLIVSIIVGVSAYRFYKQQGRVTYRATGVPY